MQITTQKNKSSNIHPIISKILISRGIKEQNIPKMLSWDLLKIPSLTNLLDMDKCSSRIIKAIENNEKIGVYGDYDVDGTTSCALFYHFFKMLEIEIDLVQPSRFIEGYGIHPPSIDKAHEKGITLLLTVDCGITNLEAAKRAKEVGIDLIITDHHKDAAERMPDAFAIVNPNRRDEPIDSPLRVLAGVGVAFAICVDIRNKLIQKGQKIPSLYPLLEFVALGTICDLAKLTPLNLTLARHGLKQMPQTSYPGIRSFLTPDERKLSVLSSEKLSFQIGPMINSKGRLDHPEKALLLLNTDDSEKAYEYHSHLKICNDERKAIQNEIFSEAKNDVISSMHDTDNLINIVYAPNWHEGVIGIVASKLVEYFKIPAIVFADAEEDGIIKASARSAGSLDLFSCLDACKDLFIKFGGHKAAAGLSMPKDNLKEFRKRMDDILRKIPYIERSVGEHFDIEIEPSDISLNLIKALEAMAPFGMGNPKPIFKMKNITLNSFDILKDVHVRWNLSSSGIKPQNFKGISFNYVGKWGHQLPEEVFKAQHEGNLTAYFNLDINRFNGREFIQLQIHNLKVL